MWKRLASLLFPAILTGCTLMHKSYVYGIEDKLIQAGFNRQGAGSEKEIEALKQMKQHVVYPAEAKDGISYHYHDAQFCRCSFTGSEENYQTFQQLLTEEQQRNIEENQEMQRWSIFGGARY